MEFKHAESTASQAALMNTRWTVIRRSEYRRMAWANGQGTTHEIHRVDDPEGKLLWRLSIAQVDQSGPFSDFTGYGRLTLLLSGAGLRLLSQTRPVRMLSRPGDALLFDGSEPVKGELISGPCLDFNIIVRHDCEMAFEVLPTGPAPALSIGRGTLVVVPLSGPCVLANGSRPVQLECWDTALVEGDTASLVRCETLEPAVRGPALLVARIAKRENEQSRYSTDK